MTTVYIILGIVGYMGIACVVAGLLKANGFTNEHGRLDDFSTLLSMFLPLAAVIGVVSIIWWAGEHCYNFGIWVGNKSKGAKV